jgi:hypothetical protein
MTRGFHDRFEARTGERNANSRRAQFVLARGARHLIAIRNQDVQRSRGRRGAR